MAIAVITPLVIRKISPKLLFMMSFFISAMAMTTLGFMAYPVQLSYNLPSPPVITVTKEDKWNKSRQSYQIWLANRLRLR